IMNTALKQLINKTTQDQFWVTEDFKQAFGRLDMTSVDDVFAFGGGQELVKANIASFRTRTVFDTSRPASTLFLKRYDQAPVTVQIKNWVQGRKRRSNSMIELEPMVKLAALGIGVPRPVAHGQVWQGLFETRSFLVTEKIPNAQSLEKQLPACFADKTQINLKPQRDFLQKLARFVKRFHALGYRHRDLYLSHIFRNPQGDLFLIDLARAFEPRLRKERFLIKDLAQLHFSLPGHAFTRTDRLRLYLAYVEQTRLDACDKLFIKKLLAKVSRMTRHDLKRGKTVPYLDHA
ncbi:MAG: hypothetical protein HQ515_06685, partial [Phycisphaeraceae bacterium]|nr:hypothetical protein [Phycisphaeraceae bacterium]